MSKSHVQNIKEEIEEFKYQYRKGICSIVNDAKDAVAQALYEGFKMEEHEYESNFKFLTQYLDKLLMLSYSTLEAKNQLLRQLPLWRNYLCRDGDKNKISFFDKMIANSIYEVIRFYEKYRKKVYQRSLNCLNKIKETSFSRKAKIQSHLNFQSVVLELLAWLFIDELEIYPKNELEQIDLKIDGAYKVANLFNPLERIGYEFKNLLIECKNYKEPNYKDMMQLFTYGLLLAYKKHISMPLGMIISRKNPDTNDTIWEVRGTLRQKWPDLEVVFLDVDDLSEMVNRIKKNLDPAYIMKKKIRERETIWRQK